MNFLTFNMALNDVISEWLEDGGCPVRCAELLRQIAQEVDAIPVPVPVPVPPVVESSNGD
jgi:hypothetical protein